MCMKVFTLEYCAHRGKKRASGPPVVELQMVLRHLIWVLGTRLGSSIRPVGALLSHPTSLSW